MSNNYFSILGSALVDTADTMVSFLPQVIIALIVFGLGWVFGTVIGRAITQVIRAARIDAMLHKAGMDLVSERAGISITIAGFFGSLAKWFIIVAFTIASTEILGLSQVTSLLSDVLVYIPQVIVAALVLIIATLLADFVARLVEHSVKATGIHAQAHFVAAMSRWSIIILAGIFPALTQLRIAQGLIEVLFTGAVFAISLALGLAFGLGGRDAAARTIEKMQN